MRDPVSELQAFLDGRLAGRERLEVLEAGCGGGLVLAYGAGARLTGLDLSARQLERHAALDRRIQADLESFDYPERAWDVITCWNVLEHLRRPERALEGFARAVKPGGLIVLGLPNVLSVKGLATRFLPFGAHLLAYRFLHGHASPGLDDAGPFPTHHRFSLARTGLHRTAARQGLRVVYEDAYDVLDLGYFRHRPWTGGLYRAARGLAGFLSAGRLGASELIMVMAR